ncbi:TIGR01777 family oxidoreductase [Pedobacter psychroterrae]|uniref:TIGR01777 family protein n=1 Tax=Pedobacter psychroterrae TaxID=2530453 RepID=A0A4R0NNS9_9SPHI|nr:TIGR01777 family oxidoreductase [Pedobacter psychroterrae]TCD02561.1 TIGR01777 family protein [Pedobacter psychroterrae]
MKKHILITGATGTVGKKLISELHASGHTISILSRKPSAIKNAKVYVWDVYKQQIDLNCLTGVDTVIHLAGENIAEKKWTKERKQQIIESRTFSTALLYKAIKETNAPVKTFISASAVGFYGSRGDEILTEDASSGTGFMATCCKLWEDAVDEGTSLGLRIVKFRIGVILAKGEGALASLEKPIRFFAGAALGSGTQWMPWVHIDDITAMFKNAVENSAFNSTYNACAPFPVTNATLTKVVAKQLHRPVWPFNVPEKVLEMILGKMSAVVLNSTNTSAQKILDTGFEFKFTHLEDALADIYQK